MFSAGEPARVAPRRYTSTMRTNQKPISLAATLALMAVAACGKPAAPSEDLRRDLELAGSDLQFVPTGGHTEVISSIERAPGTPAPLVTSVTQRQAPAPTVRRPQVRAPEAQPAPVAQAPVASASAAQAPSGPAIVPVPVPSVARPAPAPTPKGPPGGYKTVGEVIRDAPFPINP